ncbi:mobilization protein [Variovorax sp. J22G21]|uniref:mobilization protein n=1 Tax=Variovorax fucosicus TaxID=3053517 RepID=UPI002574E4FA|nr:MULTISPECIES: mobilization protein [unclassified Variovorax]MDM0041370.1 mobilization protein [Variovorax sp. J22R193]MDM0057734.1 mobilization protein [Variovorax sp. J22G47]MDM0060426.1 mobilization protein [Variovorax sp. J22G21]
MSSINFIGGEKGGVGKSVTARVLAQYFIDRSRPFTGYDTDRSHSSFTRFYEGFASPVVVDSFEGLDTIVNGFETNPHQSVIVDLAAQTLAPLSRWIKESDLFDVFKELGIAVNFWHVLDDGRDSTDLLGRLIDTFGDRPNYIVVQNYGRGSDFAMLLGSQSLAKATANGAQVIAMPRLHDTSMRKIDAQNTSFWKAVHDKEGPNALGLLERQRVKTWLATAYAAFDTLPL